MILDYITSIPPKKMTHNAVYVAIDYLRIVNNTFYQ